MLKVTGLEGFDNLRRKLNNLSDRAKKLDGTHQVPLLDLLTPAFVSKCSRFSSVDDLIAASGFKVDSAEDFRAIPDDQWDTFIAHNTSYANWRTMLSDASKQWMVKQLGL